MMRWLGLLTVVLALLVLSSVTALALAPVASDAPVLDARRSYPGWVQVNDGGFGDVGNGIGVLASFNGSLYAGTQRDVGAAGVWRSNGSGPWANVVITGWSSGNSMILDMKQFGAYLYVATYNEAGGEIWRTNGNTWEKVGQGGLGDPSTVAIDAFYSFGGQLYAVGGNFSTGIKLWRSPTGNAGSWVSVPVGAMGGSGTMPDVAMTAYSGYLYLGLSRNNQAELWRSNNGASWTPVFTGSRTVSNTHVSALAEWNGNLYAGFRNPTGAAQIWRASDGLNWQPVTTSALGQPGNKAAYGLVVFGGKLYAVFLNYSGAQVWRTSDAHSWEGMTIDGWGGGGDVGWADYWNRAGLVFNNRLYIGTLVGPSGGEIWKKTVTANFYATPTIGRFPLFVRFANTSSGDYTNSFWTFGDGATSPQPNPTHTYPGVGAYTVTLTVSDGVESSTMTRTNYILSVYQVYEPIIISNR